MKKPYVWLACDPPENARLDFSSLRGYGEIMPVFKGLWPAAEPERALDIARHWADKRYDATLDYVCSSPLCDPLAIALMLIALRERHAGDEVRWMRWDRRTDSDGNRTRHGYYTPVTFNVGG